MKQRIKKRRGRKWKVEKVAQPPQQQQQQQTSTGGAAAAAQAASEESLPDDPSRRELETWLLQIRSGQFDRKVKIKGETGAMLS